jgi:tripartite-type tricarboxylate transporter receptor subunit TctC
MELFALRAGIKVQHISYKGGAPATQDLLAGVIPVMMLDYSTAAQYLAPGRLRMVGLASASRLDQANTIPTIAESGYPGYEAWAWQGIVAPTGTPQLIIELLNQALLKAAADPAIQKRMIDFGGEFKGSTPAAMRSYMETETQKWAQTIKDAHISIE